MTTSTRVSAVRAVAVRPADLYGELDTERLEIIALSGADHERLAGRLDLDPEVAALAVRAAAEGAAGWAWAVRERREAVDGLRRVHATTWSADEQPLHLVDVSAVSAVSTVSPVGAVLSDRPFRLLLRWTNAGEAPVVLASARVVWAGEGFLVEERVEVGGPEGSAELTFDEERTLPVGPAELVVTVYRADGASSVFRRGVYVLPSNPLSLALGPAGATVTGSWSVRGDYRPESDTFLTECRLTVANGDGAPVSMNRRLVWEFWDGAVGTGTLVEAGTIDWPSGISVGAYGVWGGTVWFSSPRGSGVFGTFERKEDLALSIRMTASDGRVVRGDITARVLLAYGVNIIKVGDFGAQEHADLYAAVDEMQRVYERRDITLRGVDRRIIGNALAGGYPTIDSEDEFRDLLEDWSVPNDFVDVYVVQDFNWSTFNGFAGDIPGPASKGGRRDGVAVEKTGYTDGAGVRRLSVTTLAQLIGHEVGHYLGLEHQETTSNLMRSNTGVRGPELDYAQYRTMFPHGFMVFE
jgi:hypothetical protein